MRTVFAKNQSSHIVSHFDITRVNCVESVKLNSTITLTVTCDHKLFRYY